MNRNRSSVERIKYLLLGVLKNGHDKLGKLSNTKIFYTGLLIIIFSLFMSFVINMLEPEPQNITNLYVLIKVLYDDLFWFGVLVIFIAFLSFRKGV
ncbi:hypothetical protein JV33_21800 [Pectobacterium carotovorum subsp. carotovorum]|nr:hypothetical protein JV33_21800 [Pectobacterium carotovorum subsp. carotovorum]KML64957.1 hypothetical protein G032_21075 [Pectobacterium carotovorum subsp. carotovorum ICMP 5702]SHH68611.1 hypothetical protein SAMN05444147_11629 [Pectobacterium carotovorum]